MLSWLPARAALSAEQAAEVVIARLSEAGILGR